MDLLIPIQIRKLPQPISYQDRIMMVGSCFTEHIGNSLSELKFEVLENPHGILFDPISVTGSLKSYIQPRIYSESDLFQLNEVWHSWNHHSRFSATTPGISLEKINSSQREAHEFMRKADWLIITLGSSFSYRLTNTYGQNVGAGVANCHRAPAQWFHKHLLEISEIVDALNDCMQQVRVFNPNLKIIYTVSPVRHIRDGVVENNRSKARLIEAVHQVVNDEEHQYYFPAYELVIDVLRDYRFYDIDLAHPNYAATRFVLEHFGESCIEEHTRRIMEEIKKLVTSRKHRAFQPDTTAHRDFMAAQLQKAVEMKERFPFLNLDEEIRYFSRT